MFLRGKTFVKNFIYEIYITNYKSSTDVQIADSYMYRPVYDKRC